MGLVDMALIKCPECGKEISEKAAACPNCGCPSSEWKKTISKQTEGGTLLKYDIAKDIMNEFPDKKVVMISELKKRTGIPLDEAKEIIDSLLQKENQRFVNKKSESKMQNKSPYTVCPKCGEKNPTGIYICKKCSHRYSDNEYIVIVPDKDQDGDVNLIYRYNKSGEKQIVYCPRCRSSNCSHYQEQKIMPKESKVRYTINLNPLKPFTLVNKKEKVKREEQIVTEEKFICNSCGKIFL